MVSKYGDFFENKFIHTIISIGIIIFYNSTKRFHDFFFTSTGFITTEFVIIIKVWKDLLMKFTVNT